MANITNFISSPTPGGGGGGGTNVPGSSSETISGGNYVLTGSLTGAGSSWAVVAGGGGTNIQGSTSGGTRGPNTSFVGDNSSTVTSIAQNLPDDAANHANDNVYQTILSDTSGGGVFYWASCYCQYDNSLTSGTTGSVTTTAQSSVRITIDGGAPVEFIAPSGSQANVPGTGNTMQASSGIFVGYPIIRETQFSYDLSIISGRDTNLVSVPVIRDFNQIETGGLNGFNVTTLIRPRPDRSTTPVTTVEITPMGYNAEALRQLGIPGIRYETSLLVEARFNLGRSAATNQRTGVFRAGACAQQFT